jgi:hypothetical protein
MCSLSQPRHSKPDNPAVEYARLQQEISQIRASGDIVSSGAWICTYNVKHRQNEPLTEKVRVNTYFYVKLMAREPVFAVLLPKKLFSPEAGTVDN